MQIDTQVDGSAVDASTSGADQTTSGSKDSVSYDTYRKTVGEVKKLKEQLKDAAALRDKLTELEQNEQLRLGKHEETIQNLRAELDKAKKGSKDVVQKFAYKSLGQQVREEALKHGCVDPEALMKLADLSDVEIDSDTFEADKEKLADIVSGFKSTKPYLFSKDGPKVNGSLPKGGPEKGKEIDFKSMSASEIQKWLNENR